MTTPQTPSAECKGCRYGCKDCMANANAQTPSASSPDEGEMINIFLKRWEADFAEAIKKGYRIEIRHDIAEKLPSLIRSLQSCLKQAEAERDSYRADAERMHGGLNAVIASCLPTDDDPDCEMTEPDEIAKCILSSLSNQYPSSR